MIRFFRWLIWGDGHAHHWKIIRQGPRYLHERMGDEGIPRGFYYDLQCDICGNVKSKNT